MGLICFKKLKKFFLPGLLVNSQETIMNFIGIMNAIHIPVGTYNDNNAMLVRFSRQNLAEWKAEKASWENIGKKPTRKDKIAARNKAIRITQEKKKIEKERRMEKNSNKKTDEECRVEWSDVF